MIKSIRASEFKKKRIVKKTGSPEITTVVSAIIDEVIKRGDEALREYTMKFDGCVVENFEVPPSALDAAVNDISAEFIGIMERSAKNIEDFHRHQIRKGYDIPPKNGVTLGQKIVPLERVGIYIPGGTAPYPSSVLMNCIPAKLAGVKEIIIVTPPSKNGVAGANGDVGRKCALLYRDTNHALNLISNPRVSFPTAGVSQVRS